MSKVIGVLGCGWLGQPLAKSFIEDGYEVHGSTTSEQKLTLLKSQGIKPYLISLSEKQITGNIAGFLADIETLVVNVPPKLRSGTKENYVKKMQLLYEAIEKAHSNNCIFVSSTSVYGDTQAEVDEKTNPEPTTTSGKQLLASERIFRNGPNLDTTIIRFGGLIGPNRHPVTMLSGRKGLTNGNAPINLVHLDDCIGIIKAVIQNDWWNEIFNGVYPEHPKKEDYYTMEAKKRGLPPPTYADQTGENGKKITSCSLIPAKKYRFKTPIYS